MRAVLLILFFSAFQAFSQDQISQLSFHCGRGGSSSESVHQAAETYERKGMKGVLKLLDSEHTADQYLAVILFEKFQPEITQLQVARIESIYRSDELVAVCMGCTFHEDVSLKVLLDREDKHKINGSADYWLSMLAGEEASD